MYKEDRSIFNKIQRYMLMPYHNISLKFSKKDKVFVLGNPYSKASWVAEILAKKSNYNKTLSIPSVYNRKSFNSFSDFVFANASYFTPEIISENMLVFFTDELFDFFSEENFLFVFRNPVDNIINILNDLRIDSPSFLYKVSQVDKLSLNQKWKNILMGKFTNRKRNSQYIHINLAYQWVFIYKIAKIFRDKYKGKVTIIRYEDIIDNIMIDKLCDKLNLPEEKKVIIDKKDKTKRDEKFSDIKEEIIEICKNGMKEMNYL